MKNNILIAGAGSMGKNYIRNLIDLRSEFKIGNIIVADINRKVCDEVAAQYPGLTVCHLDQSAGSLAGVIQSKNVNYFAGVTQTDSHISVLKEALSVMKDGVPQITRILQEKPFGLFDEGNQSDFNSVVDTIKRNDIRFGMDSILMFSEVYDEFDWVLSDFHDFKHVETICTYGKNRTKDTRPAHMGVFGTEGTHAIDIARRLGHEYGDLKYGHGKTTQGYITEQDPDVPYECHVDLYTSADKLVNIHMSLAFDNSYREVTHAFENKNGEQLEVTLQFDQKGEDTIKVSSDGFAFEKSFSSNVKLKNALRSVFGKKAELYSIDQTLGLRQVIADIRDNANVNNVSGKPVISVPQPGKLIA